MIPAIGEPAEIHVTKGLRLYDRDGMIIERLDFGFRNIKREDERVERWVGATVGLIWDRLEKIGRPGDPQRRTFLRDIGSPR